MNDTDILNAEYPDDEKYTENKQNAEDVSMLELKQLEHLFPQCEAVFLKDVLDAYSYDLEASTAYIEEELMRDGYLNESKWSEDEEEDPKKRQFSAGMKARQKVRDPLLRLEYKRTAGDLAPGLYIVPRFRDRSSPNPRVNLAHWDGVIFIRRGFYRRGIFKFSIEIPESYPALPPKVTFHTKLFHVLVHPATGVLDLLPRFPQQRVEGDGKLIDMSHFCKYIKDIFFFQQLWERSTSPVHKAALTAWCRFQTGATDTGFLENVKECVERSLAEVYENPRDFSLKFSNISDQAYSEIDSRLKLVDQEMRKLEPDPKKCNFWTS